jgi:pimeloyl-ACP methyl ester carboxylesterase
MELAATVQGQGFPLLCLHGHPGRGSTMSVFCDRLSQSFQTFAPDLRGYGRSKVKGEFEMADHLDDLEELLDRYQIERCLLLGWSLGGILAFELALRRPDRFTGLIIVASSVRPFGNHPPISWQDLALTGIAGLINGVKPAWQWNIEQLAKRSLFRYLINQHTPTAYHYLAEEGIAAYRQTTPAAHRALNQAMAKGYNRLDAVSELTLPCLMLAGEGDRHITAASSQLTAKVLPHCRWHCYPNTAHLFPWEIPQQVLSDIEDWLRDHPEVTPVAD